MSISGDQFSVESPQTSVPGCWKQPGSCQILTYSWSWGSLTAQILNHGKYGRQEGSVVLLFLMHYVSKYVRFRVSVRGKSSWILCMIKRIGRFQDAWSISDLLLSLMFSFCRWAVLVKKTAAGLVLAPSTQVLACTSTKLKAAKLFDASCSCLSFLTCRWSHEKGNPVVERKVGSFGAILLKLREFYGGNVQNTPHSLSVLTACDIE